MSHQRWSKRVKGTFHSSLHCKWRGIFTLAKKSLFTNVSNQNHLKVGPVVRGLRVLQCQPVPGLHSTLATVAPRPFRPPEKCPNSQKRIMVHRKVPSVAEVDGGICSQSNSLGSQIVCGAPRVAAPPALHLHSMDRMTAPHPAPPHTQPKSMKVTHSSRQMSPRIS